MLLIHGSRRCSRWRTVAEDVGGAEITDSAHYVQEQQPEQVAQHILRFADAVGVIMSVA